MKVGLVQNNPPFGDITNNLARVLEVLADKKANLFVLPELFTTGYQFLNRKEALELSETIPDGPTTWALASLAKNINAFIVGGIAEREGDAVYNSALLVGPDGYIGKYQKAHLFDTEKEIFQPGRTPLEVFDIGCARVGIMICFDWRFPETARTLALKDADIIAHPANLVLKHCPDAMITRCLENRVFIATADRVGQEERIPGQPLKFMGQSQVVDPSGKILYRASLDQEEVQVVELDIAPARDKSINPNNHLFQDRREDLYRLK
ncbi:MAG: apolipoprotein N-acyltransferase [Nitrospinaceae bacterium]|nr:MAG: apolipoprotein N-acyltransferase [Nitrospinaceae bacterium]